MPPALPRFAGFLEHRSVWISLGMHPRDLASDSFTTVFPGYLTPTAFPCSLNAMAWVLQNRALPGSVPSHTTAALLWGLPLPARIEGGIGLLPVTEQLGDGTLVVPAVPPGTALGDGAAPPVLHCLLPRGGRTRIGRGAVVHRGGPVAMADVGRLRLPVQGEVLRQLGTTLRPWDLVAVAEAMIGPQARFPGQSVEALRAVLASTPGRAGTPAARRALGMALPEVRSPGETVMRLVIAAVGLPRPVPNLRVTDPRDRSVRYIDLAWEEVRLGLEYDGDGHRTTKGQWRRDEERRDQLAGLGWTLVRANGDDLRRPLRILLRVRDALARHGAVVPDAARIRRRLAEVVATHPSARMDR